MDPNEALAKIRGMAEYLADNSAGTEPVTAELANLILDLDKQLTSGFPLPEEWTKNRKES